MQISAIIRDRREKLSRLPIPLLAIAGVLLLTGLAFIHSASREYAGGEGGGFVARQLFFASLGAVIFLLAATSDYKRFAPMAFVAFLAALAMLVLCMAIGKRVNGAKSWLMIGGFGIQVAEFCKVLYIVTLAGFLRYRKQLDSPARLAIPLVLTGVLLGFILQQPDFGTAMIFTPVFFAMMWCSGAPMRLLAPMLLIGAAAMPAAYFGGLFKEHQLARIDTYVASLTGAALDRSGDGYHITMSMNAIGSGGIAGAGYGEGAIGQFDYLPERHTDFIFSVLAEETGFLGSLGLFAVYAVFLALSLKVAASTKEPFGRMLAVGIATMFFAQFMINAGMTCGVMPITGIPLPFISYGGSSLLTSLLALGILASVHAHPTHVLGSE